MTRPAARARRGAAGGSALDIAEEALHLLRYAPPGAWAAYLAGTAPFVLGLLFFWSDMSRSAFAGRHVVGASLGMAALFVWMKAWHALFAALLRASVWRTPPARWPAGRLWRLAALQAAVQPWGLAALPLAFLAAIPFPAAYAWFQNVTAMGDGADADVRGTLRAAWRQAMAAPGQNVLLIWLLSPWLLGAGLLALLGFVRLFSAAAPWLEARPGLMYALAWLYLACGAMVPLSPFGFVVAGNVALTMILLPALWQVLTGVENAFTLSGAGGVMNTTFLATVFAVSYLFLDPLVKAAYVLRCFYGQAQETGDDLRVALRAWRAAEPGAGREAAP